jgi:hypothetical protein
MADNTAQNGTATIAADDIGSGVLVQRVKPVSGPDGTGNDACSATPLPVAIRDTGRTLIQLYATGVASGTTGTETAINLIKALCDGSAPAAGAASITPTSGKRFRITSITVAARGHATATAQITKFTLRCNSGGAVTTSSNAALVMQVATPATALAYDRLTIPIEDAGLEFVGNGTLQIGITANAVFTTNAPTWDVLITGYEYTAT